MRPLVTVLYEDSKVGREFPLHHLLLRMVEDDINGLTWRIRKVVDDKAKGGVDKLLADVRATSLIAGTGSLFVLVDRDRIVNHLNQNAQSGEPHLPLDAPDAVVAEALIRTSDAPTKLRVFFLQPNMEGLIAAIAVCAPGQWPAEVASARGKSRLDGNSPRLARDFVLRQVAKESMVTVRACVRSHQPGLDALATALAQSLPAAAIT